MFQYSCIFRSINGNFKCKYLIVLEISYLVIFFLLSFLSSIISFVCLLMMVAVVFLLLCCQRELENVNVWCCLNGVLCLGFLWMRHPFDAVFSLTHAHLHIQYNNLSECMDDCVYFIRMSMMSLSLHVHIIPKMNLSGVFVSFRITSYRIVLWIAAT